MIGFNNIKTDICPEFRLRVEEFRTGTLSEDEFIRFESHRMECAQCRKILAEEERLASLMSELPAIQVSSDFRDRVLRKFRLRRESVKEKLPHAMLLRLQVMLGIILVGLLLLPTVRISMYSAASGLANALDSLPPEYREGMRISLELPTSMEISAWFQTVQAGIFESLGELGSSIAPWTGWLWGLLVFCLVIGCITLWRIRSSEFASIGSGSINNKNS